MKKVLSSAFFNSNTDKIASELLGKFLVRKKGKRKLSVMITETESYDGPYDLASHASKGMTERNKVMFGQPGFFYVYLCYGMHFMLNVVTEKNGYPAAVLIRGATAENKRILNGPGKVTKFLRIDKKINGKKINKKTGLWIEDRGIKNVKIAKRARIGVSYAGPVWANKKLRFIMKDSVKNCA